MHICLQQKHVHTIILHLTTKLDYLLILVKKPMTIDHIIVTSSSIFSKLLVTQLWVLNQR